MLYEVITGFDFAGTIQGEGKLAGIPALFIRTAGCNLRCMWWLPDGSVSRCDTPYASFDTSGAVKSNAEISIDNFFTKRILFLAPVAGFKSTLGPCLFQTLLFYYLVGFRLNDGCVL